MNRTMVTTAIAALLTTGLTVAAHAMSHEGKSDARAAFNEALNKCEEMQGDQRHDCYNEAMEQYRMAREKEQMNK